MREDAWTSGLTSYSIAACTDFGLCMVDDSHCMDWTGLQVWASFTGLDLIQAVANGFFQ